MSKKIDARQTVAREAAHESADLSAFAVSQPVLAHELIGSAVAFDAVSEAAATAVAAVDDPSAAIGPLLDNAADWGLGLSIGTLSGIQDQDFAFLVTGDPDAGGLALIQAQSAGYMVKTDYSVADTLMSRIVGQVGAYTGGDLALLHDFHDRKDVTLTGQTVYNAKEASDIIGGTAAEAISGSTGDDAVRGGAGNDNLVLGNGNDIGWGDAGNDGLAGNDGADQLWGGAGVDTIDGGAGNDFLMGGSGTDSLTGGDGNDAVLGGTDADTIDGGAGADTIIGGAGADSLTGGAGADTFMFMAGDATTGTTGRDTIADFEIGSDKIDLTGFTQTFTITDAATDPKTHYEVLLVSSDTGTTVKIDTTGDGVTDMEINVVTTDHAHLTASDFIL